MNDASSLATALGIAPLTFLLIMAGLGLIGLTVLRAVQRAGRKKLRMIRDEARTRRSLELLNQNGVLDLDRSAAFVLVKGMYASELVPSFITPRMWRNDLQGNLTALRDLLTEKLAAHEAAQPSAPATMATAS